MSDLGVGEEGIKATDVYAKFTASHCHDFFFFYSRLFVRFFRIVTCSCNLFCCINMPCVCYLNK